jgi:regulator of RNase E activity RraA
MMNVKMYLEDRDALEKLFRETLYTPVVGDILDGMGFTHQFLPQEIHQARGDFKLVGYAMPTLMIDVYGPQKKPFGQLTQALDQLKPGEIYLASGGAMRCAYWGELLTATAKMKKASGALVNGFHRDTPQMLAQNFPVFSRGCFAQDSSVRTQVVDYRCHMEIGQVSLDSGDLIFGDVDGVLVIPKKIIADVIVQSVEKAKGEKVVRNAIEKGMSATDAFAKYGIL